MGGRGRRGGSRRRRGARGFRGGLGREAQGDAGLRADLEGQLLLALGREQLLDLLGRQQQQDVVADGRQAVLDFGLGLGVVQFERDPDLRETLAARLKRDGKPVGFALYTFNYSVWTAARGIFIEDIWVVPEERRGGVARAARGARRRPERAAEAFQGGAGRGARARARAARCP